MAQVALVKELIEAGRRLVEFLDQEGESPSAAFWFFRHESEEWELKLARPEYEKIGTRAAYERLLTVFKKHEAEVAPIQFSNLSVVYTSSPLVRSLITIAGTAPNAIGDYRLRGNVINGTVVDDVLLYRMAA